MDSVYICFRAMCVFVCVPAFCASAIGWGLGPFCLFLCAIALGKRKSLLKAVLRYNRIANTGHSRRNTWLLGLSFFVSLFEELSTWLAAGETVDVPLKTMHIEGGYKFCHMLKRDCQDKKY